MHIDAILLNDFRGFVSSAGLASSPGKVGRIAFPIAHVGGIIYLAAALLGDFPVLVDPKDSVEAFPGLRVSQSDESELRGELERAVVQRSPRDRDATIDALCAFLDDRGLMKQEWPERLVIVDEFPLTGSGKVAKFGLARQIAGGNP